MREPHTPFKLVSRGQVGVADATAAMIHAIQFGGAVEQLGKRCNLLGRPIFRCYVSFREGKMDVHQVSMGFVLTGC